MTSWRSGKNDNRNKTLTSFLQQCDGESSDIGDSFKEKKTQRKSMFIEEDDTIECTFDPQTSSRHEWNSMNIEAFLARDPSESELPVIKQILKRELNPNQGNPFFLCMFETKFGDISLWLSSTILYHTPKYKDLIKQFYSQSITP
jgi:hypothetical protein